MKLEPSYSAGRNIKLCSHFGKVYAGFPQKLYMVLLYDPAISLLGKLYRRKMNMYVHTKTYTQVFIVDITQNSHKMGGNKSSN